MSLTIHLLTKNHAATLTKCLDSLSPLNAKILVGDLGSTDNTLSICENRNVSTISIPWYKDYSKARNSLVQASTTDWQMYIEPWENIQNGHDQILWHINQDYEALNVYKVAGDLITKTTRLWKKSSGKRFSRPVYESLEPDSDNQLIECLISGTGSQEDVLDILTEWKKQQPHASDIDYYWSCTYLAAGRYDLFLKHAKEFLFKAKGSSKASLMTHYYMAYIYLRVFRTPAECINHIIYCLSVHPTFAEFWCLLGDAFVSLNQWHRAAAFYDNALVLGSRRVNNDSFPVEVSKYHEYPTKMLEQCRQAVKSMHLKENV